MTDAFMTPKEAAIALISHETGRGPVNGGFATALLTAFQKADRMNTARLLTVYPEFTAAIRWAQTQGVDVLEEKVNAGYFDKM